MTIDSARLLQMLEPAVRPGSPAAGGAEQGAKPFEARSFKDLLSEAASGQGEGSADSAEALDAGNPLGRLSGLDQIENAALRRVLTQATQATQQSNG